MTWVGGATCVKRKKKEKKRGAKKEKQEETDDKPQVADSRPRRLATVKEACQYGRLSRTKLYEKLGAKVINAYKLDGRTLVDLNSIDDMLEALLEWTPSDVSK
jgi:excisionase family DNA binding protein